MNTNGQIIATLTRSETFQNYERAYTEATGMPLALRSLESWQLPFHGKRKENGFCALMAGQSHTCAACLQLQAKLAQTAMRKPTTQTCAYGLCETAVPVMLGPDLLGFLQTGQVFRRNPTRASFHQAVAQAAKRGVNINNERTRRAYFKTPVVARKKLEAVANLLTSFAEHLAMKSNQLVVQAANTEPPMIARAKQFIHEHHTDDLSLGQVSSSVHMSRFYFCKQFRKATGLSFTEFISRMRVEKAKAFLLNPNLRITEITFAAGFQSLSHFSRMFRRIVGQSPTDYREKLAGVSGSQLATIPRRGPHVETGPRGTQNGSSQNPFPDYDRNPSPPPEVPSPRNGTTFYPRSITRAQFATRAS